MNKKEKAACAKAKKEIALALQSAFYWTDDVPEEELEEFDQDDHELITTYIQKYITGICSRLNVEEFSGDPLPPKKRRNKKKEVEEHRKRLAETWDDEAEQKALDIALRARSRKIVGKEEGR